MENRSVVILGKAPRAGKVKTRLAKDIGEPAALEVYNELFQHTLSVVSTIDAKRLLYLDHTAINFPDNIHANDFIIRTQAAGGLGQRMFEAVTAVENGADKVLLIGTDCPYITPTLLEKAFQMLDETDYVIGPASDGGYYLLGGRHFPAELFSNIVWSTPLVFRETILRITGELKQYKLLPVLSDVDDVKTLQEWKSIKG